jgi:hypothetical protein
VFGFPDERQRLSQPILAYWKEAITDTQAIPILPNELELILTNGREAIATLGSFEELKVAKVSIDIGNWALLVDKSLIQARRVRAYVSK